MATAFAKTSRRELRSVEADVQAEQKAVGTVLGQVDDGVQSGQLTRIMASAGDQARAALTRLMDQLGPQLDALLATRIDGFRSNAYVVEAAALVAVLLVAVLLVGYLLVGFYRSATVPLRRMGGALQALADGDLTRQVTVDTGDEVGQMGTALNGALTRIREAIQAVRVDADGVAGETGKGFAVVAGEVKDLAQQTGQATEDIAARANAIQADAAAAVAAIDQIGAVIARINDFQSTIASAVEEQSAITTEMSRGIAEVATGSYQIAAGIAQVTQAGGTHDCRRGLHRPGIEELARTAERLRSVVTRFIT